MWWAMGCVFALVCIQIKSDNSLRHCISHPFLFVLFYEGMWLSGPQHPAHMYRSPLHTHIQCLSRGTSASGPSRPPNPQRPTSECLCQGESFSFRLVSWDPHSPIRWQSDQNVYESSKAAENVCQVCSNTGLTCMHAQQMQKVLCWPAGGKRRGGLWSFMRLRPWRKAPALSTAWRRAEINTQPPVPLSTSH